MSALAVVAVLFAVAFTAGLGWALLAAAVALGYAK